MLANEKKAYNLFINYGQKSKVVYTVSNSMILTTYFRDWE